MKSEKELADMARQFRESNPRYLDLSLDTIHYGVFRQTGTRLTAKEFKEFLLFLSGHDFTLETVEQALVSMPEWLAKMYEK